MDDHSLDGVSRRLTEDASDSLFALRDSLVELAMMFRDMQFELDTIQRDQVCIEVDRIVQRVRKAAI
jgi:hypothetical protein